MMAYQDSRVSEDQRDEIQAVAPWVVSSSAGKYQYTSSQTVTSLSQWDLMRSMGNVETLQPFGDQNSFVAKVTDERQVNDAWLQYDQLKNLEYATMQQNGWSTSSPQYTIWNETYMQPALVQMEQQYPAWGHKFAQVVAARRPRTSPRPPPRCGRSRPGRSSRSTPTTRPRPRCCGATPSRPSSRRRR